MNAVTLLGTLKKSGLSNTETLVSFFTGFLKEQGVNNQVIKLVDHNILPGTYLNMGAGDAWPEIYEQIEAANIIIFATPIWWGNQSSELQRVIERLDEVHDQVLAGKPSPLEGKVAGVIITGDSDGSQHIIGNISNFINAIGMSIPPYCTLAVQMKEQAKGSDTTKEELLKKYENEYTKMSKTMANELVKVARINFLTNVNSERS
jgi:multimeric flavodoxin WrbA